MRSFYIILLLACAACSEVRLIGAYDPKVDDGIESISKQVSKIFVEIDDRIDEQKDWSYKNFRDDYARVETDLKVLRTRVSALPRYGIIKDQLVLLDSSIQVLQRDHRSGFVAPGVTDVAVLKKAIEVDEKAITASLTSMLALQDELKRKK